LDVPKLFDIIQFDDGNKFRILFDDGVTYALIQLGITKTNLFTIVKKTIISQLILGGYKIIKDDSKLAIDYDSLTPYQQSSYEFASEIINEIFEDYTDARDLVNQKSKAIIQKVLNENNICKATVWKYIRLYLQSGYDKNSLIPLPKTVKGERLSPNKYGRKCLADLKLGVPHTEHNMEIFEKYRKLYIKQRDYSIKNVYNLMCYEVYGAQFLNTNTPGTPVEDYKPILAIPTERQFYYHVSTRSTEEEKISAIHGRREARNSHRMTTSDTLIDTIGPGYICEVDEWESDLECVSRYDSSQIIGRAIVYLLIDVSSKCIVAFSVGIDNNSDDGIMNLFINLADDNKELFERYGFAPISGTIPAPFIPLKIRSDRGAEYLSDAFKKQCKALGITSELVTPASGSYKPNIEQSFHRLDRSSFSVLGNNYGRINKNYESRHKQTACMNLDDVTKIVLNFVLTHNTNYMKDFHSTQDMVNKNIDYILAAIWKYGEETYGMKKPVSNIKQFMYDVLKPIEIDVTRDWIKFNKRFYLNDDDYIAELSYKNNHRVQKIEARYDPRCINNVYYRHPGKPEIYVAYLNPKKTGNMDFVNMSEYEVKLYNLRKAELDRIGKLYNRDAAIMTTATVMDIAKEAKERQELKPSSKDIRNSRAAEKAMDNRIRGKRNMEKLSECDNLEGMSDNFEEHQLCVPLVDNIRELDIKSETINDYFSEEPKNEALLRCDYKINETALEDESFDMYEYFCKGEIKDV